MSECSKSQGELRREFKKLPDLLFHLLYSLSFGLHTAAVNMSYNV